MIENDFLPIGSVVILKEAKKRIMIIGYLAKGDNTDGKVYDYIGCLYPEGVLSSDQSLLFEHSQIEKVFQKGYVDEEQQTFISKLKEELPNILKSIENESTTAVLKSNSTEEIKPITIGE